MSINNRGIQHIWARLTGNAAGLTMENRVFNYVCLISMPILVVSVLVSLYIRQAIMVYVLCGVSVVLVVVYYFSRFRQQYHTGIVMYTMVSYLLLILNYYTDAGIKGPTLCLFFLTLHLLVAIGKPKQLSFWIVLHMSIAVFLLYSEYTHPLWVTNSYSNKKEWFVDIISNYAIAMVFIFTITSYLRRSFNQERILAEERALAILNRNEMITGQNKMLEKVNEEKNKLFSIVSHDLKSPLDSITGYLALMSENLLEGEEKVKIETELLEQTKYTSDLLMNLLSWAKTQMDGVAINLAPLYLKDLVEETAKNKTTRAAHKGIKLTYAIDPAFEVICDGDMLRIVLRNLINNAIKFTLPGGEVIIKVRKNENKAEISIQDTGIGIPADKREDLFTLRTRSTYGTNKEKGTGLGLMMCKEFMLLQHGDIWFESEEGVGSVFYITLPLALA